MRLIIPILITAALFVALGLKIYYLVAIYKLRLRIYNEYVEAEKKRGMV